MISRLSAAAAAGSSVDGVARIVENPGDGTLMLLAEHLAEQVRGGILTCSRMSPGSRTGLGESSEDKPMDVCTLPEDMDSAAGSSPSELWSWPVVGMADTITAPIEAATQLAVDEVLHGCVAVAAAMTAKGFDVGVVEPPTRWSMSRLRLRSMLAAGAIGGVAVTARTRGEVESNAANMGAHVDVAVCADGAEIVAGVEMSATVAPLPRGTGGNAADLIVDEANATAVGALLRPSSPRTFQRRSSIVRSSLVWRSANAVSTDFSRLALEAAKLRSRSRAS